MQGRIIRSLVGLLAFWVLAVGSLSVSQAQQSRERAANMSQGQATEFNKFSEQGQKLLQQQEYGAAINALDRACKIYLDAAEVHSNLGIAYMGLANNEAAIKCFCQSLALEPDNAVTAFNLANCYLGQGNVAEARLWLQKSIDCKTADAELITNAKAVLVSLKSAQWDVRSQSDKNSDDYFDNLVTTKTAARWPEGHIPLKVFFEDCTLIPHYQPNFNLMLQDAFDKWTSATGGKLSWAKVTNKNNADIVCKWQVEPEKSLPEGGETIPDAFDDPNGNVIFEHAVITIFTMRPNPVAFGTVPINDTEAQALCLHEVGHALGLAGHSPNGDDCMGLGHGFSCTATILSQRDKNTIVRLYQSYPSSNHSRAEQE